MCRVKVLKFGGSVLRDEHTMIDAAQEVLRWREQGYAVVAVVSALHGVTDKTLERAKELVHRRGVSEQDDVPTSESGEKTPTENPSICAHAIAAASAIGEHESAAWLALHLGLLGQPASVITPAAARLTAQGPAQDADPVSVDLGPIERALVLQGVAIVPGFAAIDENARPVTLGRGGSDLTALFLAAELREHGHDVTCRLVKDVDGLYDRDPKQAGATRFEQASYEDCLNTDGSIIQFKAVRLAQERGVRFELGAIGKSSPTTIGERVLGLNLDPKQTNRLAVPVGLIPGDDRCGETPCHRAHIQSPDPVFPT